MEDKHNLPFGEFINEKPDRRRKFVVLITKSEYAIDYDEHAIHRGMMEELINKTRPKLETVSEHCSSSIEIFGVHVNNESDSDWVMINLPNEEMLSMEQILCLINILKEIETYNKNHAHGFRCTLLVDDNSNLKDIAEYIENTSDVDWVTLISRLAQCAIDSIDKVPVVEASEDKDIGIPHEKCTMTAEEIAAKYIYPGDNGKKTRT